MTRSMVLLTWGHTNPKTAKTAAGLLRFCPEECVAVFDPDNAGRKAQELLDAGGDTPVIADLAEVPQADTLAMGIAPPGGKIPSEWRVVILAAIERGMHILSGLHDFISEDAELQAAATRRGVTIFDVRKNNFKQVARRPGFRRECLRLHTMGHDCSVGKMLVSLVVARGLQFRGIDAHFVATGQTGIMISGEGLPIDCIVADFVSGAAEKLVLDHQHHQVIIVEGQGSLTHPSYSAVTLGLLHGCMPHALIFVFEAGRDRVGGLEHVAIPDLSVQRQIAESMASFYQPCKTIAVAMNGSKLSAEQAIQVAQRVSKQLQLPVVDVIRDGPDPLLDVVEAFYREGSWRRADDVA